MHKKLSLLDCSQCAADPCHVAECNIIAASKWRPKFHSGDTTGKSIFCNPLENRIKIVHTGQLYCKQSKVKALVQLTILTQSYFC
jgi:hypothetical protein